MKPLSEDIEFVIKEALSRYNAGKAEHGELDLSRDKRNFLHEAEKELLDCINYCVFQILKFRMMSDMGKALKCNPEPFRKAGYAYLYGKRPVLSFLRLIRDRFKDYLRAFKRLSVKF